MGLFSDKKVLHAETISAKLFPEEADPLKKAVTSAVLTNGGVSDFILAAHISGFALNAERYLRYGEKSYVLGLPKTSLGNIVIKKAPITEVLTSLVGSPIYVLAVTYSKPVLSYFGYEKLAQHSMPFDAETDRTTQVQPPGNVIYALRGFFVKNGKLLASFVDIAYVSMLDNPPPQISDIPGMRPPAPPARAWLFVDLGAPPDMNKDYLQVQYHRLDEPVSKVLHWTYDPSTKQYPSLDDQHSDTDLGSPFYPIAPLRIDGKFITHKDRENNPKDLKDSTKKLLKRLNLELKDLIKALEGPEEEKDSNGKVTNEDEINKDLDKMDDAYFMFALDIYTDVQESLDYLHSFFTSLGQISTNTKAAFDKYVADIEDAENNGSNITDGDYLPGGGGVSQVTSFNPERFTLRQGKDFWITIGFNYITYTPAIQGKLSKRVERTFSLKSKHSWDNHTYNPSLDELGSSKKTIYNDSITFKKRIDENTYSQVTVHGINHATSVSVDGKRKAVRRELSQEEVDKIGKFKKEGGKKYADSKGDSAFYIPLAYDIVDMVHSRVHRDILLYDACMLVIMAGEIETIKWYQKGIFKVLLMIVVFAISVALLMFGPAGLSLSAAIISAFTTMITAMVISVVAQLIFKMIGGKLGAILSVIFTVIALVMTGQIQLNFDMVSVSNLLDAIQIFTDLGNMYLAVDMESMAMEYQDFLKDYEEKMEELDDAQDLLPREGNPFDPLYVTKKISSFRPGETVSQFYDRVLSNNPGVLSLDQIKGYHSNLLKLPKPTVGGTYLYN